MNTDYEIKLLHEKLDLVFVLLSKLEFTDLTEEQRMYLDGYSHIAEQKIKYNEYKNQIEVKIQNLKYEISELQSQLKNYGDY